MMHTIKVSILPPTSRLGLRLSLETESYNKKVVAIGLSLFTLQELAVITAKEFLEDLLGSKVEFVNLVKFQDEYLVIFTE